MFVNNIHGTYQLVTSVLRFTNHVKTSRTLGLKKIVVMGDPIEMSKS